MFCSGETSVVPFHLPFRLVVECFLPLLLATTAPSLILVPFCLPQVGMIQPATLGLAIFENIEKEKCKNNLITII